MGYKNLFGMVTYLCNHEKTFTDRVLYVVNSKQKAHEAMRVGMKRVTVILVLQVYYMN